MVSSEMSELIGMSDRIYVFCNGNLTGHLEKTEMNEEKILQYASEFVNTENDVVRGGEESFRGVRNE